MALNTGINHVVLVKGNLKTNKGILSIVLANEEIRSNLWQISFHECSFAVKEPINNILGFSTNFVKDVTFDETIKEKKNYFPILKQTALKANATDKKVIRFEEAWFYINNSNEYFTVDVIDLETQKNINLDCEVFLTIIFQRVK